jgi:hypothetical protein
MTTKGSFYIDVYGCYVNIIVCDDILKSINYYLKKWDCNKHKDEPGAFCLVGIKEDEGNYYLFFNRKEITSNYINHEKSHLLDYILKERGIKAVDEPRAYLDGFVSDKINAFFKRRKIKIK